MGIPVASRTAVQHFATTSGLSMRLAPKAPAPATLSLGHPQFRLISSYLHTPGLVSCFLQAKAPPGDKGRHRPDPLLLAQRNAQRSHPRSCYNPPALRTPPPLSPSTHTTTITTLRHKDLSLTLVDAASSPGLLRSRLTAPLPPCTQQL